MGIQERDYWQERYHKLIGLEAKRKRSLFRVPVPRFGIGHLLTFALLAFVLVGLASMAYRFIR